jgi:hypothetical protein
MQNQQSQSKALLGDWGKGKLLFAPKQEQKNLNVTQTDNVDKTTAAETKNTENKQETKVSFTKPVVGVFPNLSKLKKDGEELLKFSLQTTTPIKQLKLVSNCAYWLYANGTFVADGGLRCVSKEAIVDTFDFENDGATNIYVLLHYIGEYNNMWHRAIFPDPFFCDLDTTHEWNCEKSNSVWYGTKISTQLPRQNIIPNTPEIWEKMECQPLSNFNWKLIEKNIKFSYPEMKFTSETVTPQKLPRRFPFFTKKGEKPKISITQINSFNNLPLKNEDNLMEILRHNRDQNVVCYTFDTGRIGLHKLFVTTTDSLVVYYSEVGNIDEAWSTGNRNKVHMADAFLSTTQPKQSSIEWRGCRYLHVVTTKNCQFQINCFRKEYNFGWVSTKVKEPKYLKILQACMNNLTACVDGGVVDTCWRERAQWVGDAYMSLKALKLLCDPSKSQPIIDNVLRQIWHSYDQYVGMVQGAYPMKNPNFRDFYMPSYHLLWCLTVLEQNSQDFFGTVEKSLELWEKKYVNKSKKLLENLPGWHFVDWYSDDTGINCVGKDDRGDITKPNVFVNILYLYLCSQLKIPTQVSKVSIDTAFLTNDGQYSLYPNTPSCIQATSMAISYLDISDDVKINFLPQVANGLMKHTMYYGYFIAKALGKISAEDQKNYIIQKYWECANTFGNIREKITDESSRAHGWSIGFIEFILDE